MTLYQPFKDAEEASRRKEATAKGILLGIALVALAFLLVRIFLAPALLNILWPALWH